VVFRNVTTPRSSGDDGHVSCPPAGPASPPPVMPADRASASSTTRNHEVGRDSGGSISASLLALSPLLAILAIIALLGALVWLVDRDERESQQQELIRDALWVEQSLRFQIDADTARLSRLAADLEQGDAGTTMFLAQAGQLVQVNRELVEILWLDSSDRLLASVPRQAGPGWQQDEPLLRSRQTVVRRTGRGSMTAPFRHSGADAGVVAFVAPVARPGDAEGTLVAVFSIATLLTQQVPWWIAERRALSVLDGGGTMVASRSAVAPEPRAPSYSVEIGAPLSEVRLAVTSFRDRSSLAHNGLVGAMVGLGLFAAAGLVARERQIRRRRAAEAALGEEHALRRAMESSLQVGVRARDLDGRILYVNPAFCRLVGYSESELIGREPPMPYWLPEDLEHTQRLHDAVLAGQAGSQGMELTFQRKDGSRVDVLIYEAPLVDARGGQRGWMGSFVDITERKRIEDLARAQAEKMQHTARLVTMGEMASLLAHDLNQPLAAIASYRTGLQNLLADRAETSCRDIAPAIEAIGDAAERAGRIVRRVHNFVRRSEPRLEPVDVRDIVGETLALLEPELRKAHVLCETATQPMLPLARADRVLVEQVLVNLVRNAVEAVRGMPAEARRLLVRTSWPAERAAISVEVRDWGSGVAPTVRQQLFSPFVSTKPGGMGMGLTICRSILELHGTDISYEPGEGGGSVFRFTLPIAEAQR